MGWLKELKEIYNTSSHIMENAAVTSNIWKSTSILCPRRTRT